MGQALYRKYRSRSLVEVVGQDHITKTLANALKSGKVSHAYLFTGPRGVGKTSIARILAHEINGLPYDEASQHLDIIEIDAASNRRIDDIRDLRDKVHVAPVSARHKVYIIDEVHMLTGESFNALLKTLEEPPAHAIFILATTEAHKVPATIMSRTQRFHFRSVPLQQVADHLRMIANAEGITIDDDALAIIAAHGDGSFRDSISLLDQVASLSAGMETITGSMLRDMLGIAPEETVNAIADAVIGGDRSAVHAAVTDSLERTGVHVSQLTRQLITLFSAKALQPGFGYMYQLLDELIDVPKSQQPQLKLLITLLKWTAQAGGDTERPATQTPLAATPPKATPPKSSPRANRTVALDVTPVKRATPAAVTVIDTPDKPQEPAPVRPDGKPMTLEDWPGVLEQIRQHNPPLFSVLKNANVSMENNALTFCFTFKLHQKKIEEGKYRTKLTSLISECGFICPDIIARHDATMTVTPFATVAGGGADDEVGRQVLAMMS